MAKELKINTCWYHPGEKAHYDIPKKRIEEIQNKCQMILSDKQILQIIKGELNIYIDTSTSEYILIQND